MKPPLVVGTLALLACAGCVGSSDSAPFADELEDDIQDPEPTPNGCENLCDTPSLASVDSLLDSTNFTPNTTRTRDNPLKGLMTSYLWGEPANDFPDQLEFLYLPMDDLWDQSGETLDTGLEPHLVAAAARGHHAVIRVYIDYPTLASGLPGYLTNQVPCTTYSDHGGGCSPDYDDPELVTAMLGLISAMGEHYDADPRLGFVQVGLLGFWGEWHTWPYPDWFPTEATQNAVLGAYEEAFITTHLQVRKPMANSVSMRIGYHDDSFAYSTIGEIDWFFLPDLESAGAEHRWQQVPIGGEVRPELQATIFESSYETDTYAQDIDQCIEATHATYLLNYQAFNEGGVGYAGAERDHAEATALALGYRFEVQSATLSAGGLLDRTVEAQVSVEITQSGVAPFYYPLFLTVDSEALDGTRTAADDLQTLLPGESRSVTVELGQVSVDVLNAPLSLGLSSPMLLSDQKVALATESPWTQDNGALTLHWELGCETEADEFVSPGEVVSINSDGCICVCDVDGQIRACGQETCQK
ncbi:MAG TPA: hypothetical protein DIU15_12015 [Deltaproteobacteria bacterium]|nr:hypothetical protein [Deltaproteobacteria bacterium]HCP46763.1 hypothetical protein [Deltaproteobacteria bacterium]